MFQCRHYILPLFLDGRNIASDVTEYFCSLHASETAGYFLMNLHHSYIPFTAIIVKRNAEVIHKAQYLAFMFHQTHKQISCRTLGNSSSCTGSLSPFGIQSNHLASGF